LRKKGDFFRNDQDREDKACEIRGTSFAANPLPEDLFRLISFFRTFQELERRCPLHINPADWQQAVDDGRKFLTRWGQRAETLGWTPRDLFGLHAAPERPAANYRRLSRYDETGLIWLLRGRPVVVLTETTAAMQGATAVVTYRKLNKPALGPLGDSLDDMGAATRAVAGPTIKVPAPNAPSCVCCKDKALRPLRLAGLGAPAQTSMRRYSASIARWKSNAASQASTSFMTGSTSVTC
jgi:hypothetical protein